MDTLPKGYSPLIPLDANDINKFLDSYEEVISATAKFAADKRFGCGDLMESPETRIFITLGLMKMKMMDEIDSGIREIGYPDNAMEIERVSNAILRAAEEICTSIE